MSEKPNNQSKSSQNTEHTKVRFETVTESSDGQRIDNYLLRELKNVPRSLIYRILRKGEVRVDKKRVKPTKKLLVGEVVRIPPVKITESKTNDKAPDYLLDDIEKRVLLEDNDIILINKPSGLTVHAGSGNPYGLIEAFRQLRPNLPFVELAHRLDKETSGIIILAKNRETLLNLHHLFKNGGVDKRYQALVYGDWNLGTQHVSNTLVRGNSKRNKVRVAEGGKRAESIFKARRRFREASLLEVELLTGRMHQIRTQLAEMGLPILGDSQYGDFSLNRQFKKATGLKRLFLHAFRVEFKLDRSGTVYKKSITLEPELQKVVTQLDHDARNKFKN